jgi:hypothetical protein
MSAKRPRVGVPIASGQKTTLVRRKTARRASRHIGRLGRDTLRTERILNHRDDLLARLSPARYAHINPYGKLSLSTSKGNSTANTFAR